MSLITRCPACSTLFKVVPDQLRISEGWVRCGQCDEVFDANVHLQGGAQKQEALPAAESQVAASEALAIDQAPVETEAPVPGGLAETTPEQALVAQMDWPEESAFERDPLLDVRPGAAFTSDPALNLELPGENYAPGIETDQPLQVESSAKWESVAVDEEAPAFKDRLDSLEAPQEHHSIGSQQESASQIAAPKNVQPSFLRVAKQPSAWSRPWVRRSLVAASAGLAVALAVQVVVYERDRLAANFVGLRPALVALCDAFGCQVSPHRQIDSVVIESSAFVKLRGDVYRLNITLKNTAPIDIAAPAVELTLTDLQEQPMIRQVLLSKDLGAVGGSLLAGADLTVSLPVHVKIATPSDRISGYRLLAFYP